MRLFPWSRRIRFVARAFLTLLAVGLFAPAPTEAGCGHPLERPGIALDPGHLGGSIRQPDQAPAPKPCSGPSCSNKSAPPQGQTSSPQAPPKVELWGLTIGWMEVSPPDAAARAPEDAEERPILLPTSIFHPPRRSR